MVEKGNACRLLTAKPEGKRPLEGPRYMQVDNLKMDVGERGWTGLIWLRIGTRGWLL
jgi:hypothetical protein